MTQAASFDPSLVIASFLGITPTMYAKGTFIEFAYDTDAVTDEVGANGDVVAIVSADKRGTYKLTLMRASPTNDQLSKLVAVPGKFPKGPAIVKDFNGTSLSRAGVCWIKKIPDALYSTEAATVVWEIRAANAVHALGGMTSL